MKSTFLSRLILATAIGTGSTAADPEVEMPPQPQVSFTVGSSNTWNADWVGIEKRVYFFQWSLDLVTWQFAPFMEFGTGTKSRGCEASAPKFFVRLVYYDDPNIESLEQAMNADFDGDGVSNFDEINVLGTNPMLFSTNGSGISDGAQDWDGDGISNADEVALGLDPDENNTGGASGAATVGFSFDDIGRLTGMTSPVASASYALDAEGNID